MSQVAEPFNARAYILRGDVLFDALRGYDFSVNTSSPSAEEAYVMDFALASRADLEPQKDFIGQYTDRGRIYVSRREISICRENGDWRSNHFRMRIVLGWVNPSNQVPGWFTKLKWQSYAPYIGQDEGRESALQRFVDQFKAVHGYITSRQFKNTRQIYSAMSRLKMRRYTIK